jgi:tyrosine-protein phosphatase SIW14
MRVWVRWALGVVVALAVVGVPAAYYRAEYTARKRFREVTPGKFYRSGQFTAGGLRDIVRRYGIRTVINLQEENKDPFMPEAWLAEPHVRESDLCRELGVRYVVLDGCPELMTDEQYADGKRPKVIDQYLALLDDPKTYPVLLHCKAGLHRTGRLTAIYRMEYEGWTVDRAMEELKANGYGSFMASEADQYIVQYVGRHRTGVRNGGGK